MLNGLPVVVVTSLRLLLGNIFPFTPYQFESRQPPQPVYDFIVGKIAFPDLLSLVGYSLVQYEWMFNPSFIEVVLCYINEYIYVYILIFTLELFLYSHKNYCIFKKLIIVSWSISSHIR